MVFIPEIGDHLMLGSSYNDPNRPLVLGSLFNGTTGDHVHSQVKTFGKKVENAHKHMDDYTQSISKESFKKIKEIMSYFKKESK